ncbi:MULTISPECIES: hypothetical protein [unclassified Colwellia]|nr:MULTISPECIES: hypothetical protein [unclassified Colwellia]
MKRFNGIGFNGIGTDYIESYLSWFRFIKDNKAYADKTWIKAAL